MRNVFGTGTFELEKPVGLGEQIATAIRSAITDGTLNPGDRLAETQIAAKFGVSRTPVREAIQELERDGLVVHLPSGATVVGQLSLNALEDITGVRQVIEPYAAQLAAKRMTPQGLAELKELYERMLEAAQANNVYGFLKWNEAFHASIFQASGSPCLVGLVGPLNLVLYFRAIAELFDPDNLISSWREHEPILQALEDGDAETAEQAYREHIGHTLLMIQKKRAAESGVNAGCGQHP